MDDQTKSKEKKAEITVAQKAYARKVAVSSPHAVHARPQRASLDNAQITTPKSKQRMRKKKAQRRKKKTYATREKLTERLPETLCVDATRKTVVAKGKEGRGVCGGGCGRVTYVQSRQAGERGSLSSALHRTPF